MKYFINVEYFNTEFHGEKREGFEFQLTYAKDNYNLSARFFGNENLEEMECILEDFVLKNEFDYYELF